ncbi:MAG: hypothetical protein FWG14_06995 [Peptococcaceae bacterium]|nr:hypothetical protein [Peptococcaceae bacterium]
MTTFKKSDARTKRAERVLALGQRGRDVSAYLNDADEAVQACAALFVRSPRASVILIEALTRPDQVDDWFEDQPAFFGGMCTRFALLQGLVRRRITIEEMLPAALTLIAKSSEILADYEWGPILQVAFPEPLPQRLTEVQRAVLEALVANDNIWNPNPHIIDANASAAKRAVGLPISRDEAKELIGKLS